MTTDVPARRRRITTPDGVGLAVHEAGPTGVPAIVVAHGVGSSARFVLAAFAGPVLASGRRLVTFDLRGHGDSDPVREPDAHGLDRYAADLATVVEATAGHRAAVARDGGRSPSGPDVTVVGVSLGGHAAVRAVAAGLLDVRAVVACLPAWTGRAITGQGPHAAIAAEVRATGIPTMTARLRADTSMPAWLRDTLVTDYARHDPESLTVALLALDGGEAPGLDELAGLPVPFAAVGWPDDPGHPLAVAEDWAAAAAGPVVRLHLDELDRGLERLGETALSAVTAIARG